MAKDGIIKFRCARSSMTDEVLKVQWGLFKSNNRKNPRCGLGRLDIESVRDRGNHPDIKRLRSFDFGGSLCCDMTTLKTFLTLVITTHQISSSSRSMWSIVAERGAKVGYLSKVSYMGYSR